MTIVSTAAAIAAPWAHLYADSKLVSTGVTFAHLGGMLFGGGFALAADRATLRLRASGGGATAHLEELHAIHRPVLLALGITFLSGFLLLASDVKTFLPAPLFWVKMGLVGVLLGNGVRLQRAEARLRAGAGSAPREWRRLRASAWMSLALWTGALLLGTALLAV